MKNRYLQLLYALVLLTDLLAIALHLDTLRYVSKPLLVLLLAAEFLAGTAWIPVIFRVLMTAALAFSCLGDVLLLFPNNFVPGLGAFLLAHACYIAFFLKIRYTNYPLALCKWAFIFITEAVVLVFIFTLLPYLGNLALPVIIYAIVISVMLQSVMHAFRLKEQRMGWYSLAGAMLFMLSDALIAFQHFKGGFAGENMLIMLTYGLAQWGIVSGALRYLQQRRSAYYPH